MHCSRRLLGGLVTDAMAALEARGLFPDSLASEIERDFWPELLGAAARHTSARANARRAVDGTHRPPLSARRRPGLCRLTRSRPWTDILRHALDRRARAGKEAKEAREERRPKKGWVRLHLPTAEGGEATRVVGPIQVRHMDTVGDVEERLRVRGAAQRRRGGGGRLTPSPHTPLSAQQWLVDHPGEVEVPEGRVLQLQQDGEALPRTAALLDLPQGRNTPLEVSFVAQSAAEEQGEEEGSPGGESEEEGDE